MLPKFGVSFCSNLEVVCNLCRSSRIKVLKSSQVPIPSLGKIPVCIPECNEKVDGGKIRIMVPDGLRDDVLN